MNDRFSRLADILIDAGRNFRRGHGCHSPSPHSVTQLTALIFLKKSGTASMKQVAEHLGVTPPTASVMIESLVQSGLIKRTSEKSDRRQLKLALTPKGKKQTKLATDRIVKKMKAGFSVLTAKELDQFIAIMEKVSRAN